VVHSGGARSGKKRRATEPAIALAWAGFRVLGQGQKGLHIGVWGAFRVRLRLLRPIREFSNRVPWPGARKRIREKVNAKNGETMT